MTLKEEVIDIFKKHKVDVSKIKFRYNAQSPYLKNRGVIEEEVWLYPKRKNLHPCGHGACITATDWEGMNSLIGKDLMKDFIENWKSTTERV